MTVGQLVDAARIQQKHREARIEMVRLSRVASQTTNGVVITDVDGRVERVNEGLTRITGYTLDEMHGRKPADLPQSEATDPATVWRQCARPWPGARASRSTSSTTPSPASPTGSTSTAPPARCGRGAAGLHGGRVRHHQGREEHLQETTRLLEGIFENVPSMIFLKDANDLRLTYFNRAGEALIGHARADLIGRNDHNCFPREQADAFTAADRAVLALTGVVPSPRT